MKVIELKSKVNQDAAEILKDALEKVESGEYVGVTVVFVTKDGNISSDMSYTSNNILMWASLEHAARFYYESIIQEQNEIDRD
jgi:hypothetical protein